MDKLICFSIFGRSDIYNLGLVENCLIMRDDIFFDGWKAKVYYSSNPTLFPKKEILDFLKKLEFVELIDVNRYHFLTFAAPTIWRYYHAMMQKYSICLIRDADSLIGSDREKKMINKFINSDFKFQIIRDHPKHYGIMAGLVAFKHSYGNNFKHEFKNWIYEQQKYNHFSDAECLEMVRKDSIKQTQFVLAYDNLLLEDECLENVVKIKPVRDGFMGCVTRFYPKAAAVFGHNKDKKFSDKNKTFNSKSIKELE